MKLQQLKKKPKITKLGIGVSIDKEKVIDIDTLRKKIPRSVFIMKLINLMFDNHYEEIQKYVDSQNKDLSK